MDIVSILIGLFILTIIFMYDKLIAYLYMKKIHERAQWLQSHSLLERLNDISFQMVDKKYWINKSEYEFAQQLIKEYTQDFLNNYFKIKNYKSPKDDKCRHLTDIEYIILDFHGYLNDDRTFSNTDTNLRKQNMALSRYTGTDNLYRNYSLTEYGMTYYKLCYIASCYIAKSDNIIKYCSHAGNSEVLKKILDQESIQYWK